MAADITIGMPVFNGAETIRAAIESLLAQTWRDFELVIADNASTDQTQAICEEYAARDGRIRYVRHQRNMGATHNFIYVLEQAKSEFFIWAAADDTRSPDFLEVNRAFLIANPQYCASISPTRNAGMGFDPVTMGDESLDAGSYEERVLAFFRVWHGNARFYSLFRRAAIAGNKTLYGPEYAGADWGVTLEIARDWKFNRAEKGELVLGMNGISKHPDFIKRMRKKPIEKILPIWQLSVYMMRLSRGFAPAARLALLRKAIQLNHTANTWRYRIWRQGR